MLLFKINMKPLHAIDWLCERHEVYEAAHVSAIGEVACGWQLLLVGLHEQLDGALPDLQGRHVRQEVIAHKEAHEYCSVQGKLRCAAVFTMSEYPCRTVP